MPRRALYLEIFLFAFATILLEVSYTRVFSYKLLYYFTYVIIGIALLGLGTGGVLVAFRRDADDDLRRLVPACALAAGVSVLVGYLVVAWVQLDTVDMIAALGARHLVAGGFEAAKLVTLCLALFAPFLASGVAIAGILAGRTDVVHRLYFADLVGASLGCAIAVPAMIHLTPPGCVALAGACFVVAGLRLAGDGMRAPLGAVALCLAVGIVAPGRLPDPVPDGVKTMAPQHDPHVRFSQWSPVFRVDVLDNFDAMKGILLLNHDGMWGSVLARWNGDEPSLRARYDRDPRALPFALVPAAPRVAIVGSAGGNEILASLHFGAGHVTGIELNPVTVSLLTTHFADYTGRIAFDPRVQLVNAEGRSFFEGTDERWDVVWFVAPDSYAAMNAATAGAFVLSESYLYTKEMIAESLRHTTEDGIVCSQFGDVDFEHKPNRTLRWLVTARAALRDLGIEDGERHLMVATSGGWDSTTATIMLRKRPFGPEDARAFTEATSRVEDGRVRYVPGAAPAGELTAAAAATPWDELPRRFADYPFRVDAISDDAPFFWHFVPFRRIFERASAHGASSLEEGIGERLLVVLTVFVALFAAVVLVLPVRLRAERWRAMPHKGRVALYFAGLGLGFMFLEVTLIQRLTLFLGYPTYSLTVTLFALLVSTGVGSALGERWTAPRNRRLAILAAALVGLVFFYRLGLDAVMAHAVGAPLAARIAVAVLLLAPLGICLGGFMPIGLATTSTLGPHGRAYAAWAWAVNGFCSVLASNLSTMLSMGLGFGAVMLIALAAYLVGIAALWGVPGE